jgi:CBS domain-containing protein
MPRAAVRFVAATYCRTVLKFADAVVWKRRLQPKGHKMIAADIMTCDVATVRPGDTVLQAVQLMLDRQVSGLPVLDIAGKLVGIMTEADLPRHVETSTELHSSWLRSFIQPTKLAERFVEANGRHVSDVMQRDVITAEETTPLEDVVALMEASTSSACRCFAAAPWPEPPREPTWSAPWDTCCKPVQRP